MTLTSSRFPVAPIGGDGIVLRPFRPDDAEPTAAACRDPLIQRFIQLLPSPYTMDDARWWIETGAPAVFAAGGGAYAIADAGDGTLLGSAGITMVNARLDWTTIGYWVAPSARGRGVATTATRLLSHVACERGVARLELHNDWENPASQRVALAAGFRREGIARGAGRARDGARTDRLIWARLADDPPGPTPRLLPDLPGTRGGYGGQLTDGCVVLRRLELADRDDQCALHRLPEVVARSVPPVSPTLAIEHERCAQAHGRWLAGELASLTIRDAANDSYVGDLHLHYQEPVLRQAMIGYSVAPAWRGRGYASRAVRLLSEWTFTNTEIIRLVAGTAPDNIASQRVLAAAGFEREGYHRSHLPSADGTRVDGVTFALVRGFTSVRGRPGAGGEVYEVGR